MLSLELNCSVPLEAHQRGRVILLRLFGAGQLQASKLLLRSVVVEFVLCGLVFQLKVIERARIIQQRILGGLNLLGQILTGAVLQNTLRLSTHGLLSRNLVYRSLLLLLAPLLYGICF